MHRMDIQRQKRGFELVKCGHCRGPSPWVHEEVAAKAGYDRLCITCGDAALLWAELGKQPLPLVADRRRVSGMMEQVAEYIACARRDFRSGLVPGGRPRDNGAERSGNSASGVPKVLAQLMADPSGSSHSGVPKVIGKPIKRIRASKAKIRDEKSGGFAPCLKGSHAGGLAPCSEASRHVRAVQPGGLLAKSTATKSKAMLGIERLQLKKPIPSPSKEAKLLTPKRAAGPTSKPSRV